MKLAYVCGDPGVPVFGRKGCSIHVQEVLRAMRALGAEVDLFAVRVGGEAPSDLGDLRVHTLPVAVADSSVGRESALRLAGETWASRVEAAGPFDAVYERYSLWSCSVLEHACRAGIPGLLEVNAPLIEEQASHRELADAAGARAVARRAFGAASHLLAVSEEVAGYLDGFEQTRGRVEVLPNGVNAGRFATALTFRRQRAPMARGVTLGFVGTLKPWHGTHLLVEAFHLLTSSGCDLRLILVGDGPERGRLEAQVRELGISGRVTFTGSVVAEDVPAWLGAMDIAVAPYPKLVDFYFSPLKAYEYMAAGLPVVASRIGQLERMLEDGVNGVLVEPGDPVVLARALGRLAADRPLRERLGWAARATVEHRHTWTGVASRILELAARPRRGDMGGRERGTSSERRQLAGEPA